MVETLSATLAVIVGVATRHCRELDHRSRTCSWSSERISVNDHAVCCGRPVLGSLYFSEVANYIRVGLLVSAHCDVPDCADWSCGIHSAHAGARFYVLPMAAIGACISGWHYLIERSLDTGSCSATGPSCTDIWFRSFGFLTLAGMALIGFLALIMVNAIPEPVDSEDSDCRAPRLRAQWHVQQMSSCALNQARHQRRRP